ncbi:MAG: hypothetical protein AB8B78_11820 [Polaribacter sp.]
MKKIVFLVIMILCTFSVMQAQKKGDKKKDKEDLLVKVKDGKNPIIYVDGKKFDFPMELIDQSKIASAFILKKEDALKKYNSPNGVIFLTTKASKADGFSNEKFKNDIKIGAKNEPKVIVDGKVTDEKILKKLSPDKIDNIKIIKGEKAIKKYNAPNGVIIITTKKKN